MDDELFFGNDIVTVVDDDGKEHTFEELDRIELPDGRRFVALLPVYDDKAMLLEDEGDVLILEVIEEDGEPYLIQIEDEELFDEVGNIFEDRLTELYEGSDDEDAE